MSDTQNLSWKPRQIHNSRQSTNQPSSFCSTSTLCKKIMPSERDPNLCLGSPEESMPYSVHRGGGEAEKVHRDRKILSKQIIGSKTCTSPLWLNMTKSGFLQREEISGRKDYSSTLPDAKLPFCQNVAIDNLIFLEMWKGKQIWNENRIFWFSTSSLSPEPMTLLIWKRCSVTLCGAVCGVTLQCGKDL